MTLNELVFDLRLNKKISGKSFKEEVVLDFEKLNIVLFHDLEFEQCEFEKGITIENLKNNKVAVNFEKCNVPTQRKLSILNSEFRYITFHSCEISVIDVRTVIVHSSIFFFSNKGIKLLRLSNIEAKDLEIDCNEDSIDQIVLNTKNVEETIITAAHKVNNLKINNVGKLNCSGFYGQVDLNANDFQSVNISEIYIEKKSQNSKIESFTVNSDSLDGLFSLNQVEVSFLRFTSVLSQNGYFLCNNSIIKNALFYDTLLLKASWNNVTFSQTLIIDNSDFSNLTYSNVKWIAKTTFSSVELNDQWFFFKSYKAHLNENIDSIKNEREVYRQLKTAATKSQNHIDALLFYRNEMRLYWKEIRVVKTVHWGDWILVGLNRVVSDFGQSWLLPLIWLTTIHFILFMSIFNWNFSLNTKDFTHGLGEYFQLLNPVHKTPDYINTGMGLFTEFWMRVLGGFFIYHFIKATRKYGKI